MTIDRKPLIQNWLQATLSAPFVMEPLVGDASFRNYFRILSNNTTYILMDAPPPETPAIFKTIAELLIQQGLSAPRIVASNIPEGLLLISDLGNRVYLQELNEETSEKLYQDAFHALIKMQQIQYALPQFDKAFLINQKNIFAEWYLHQHLSRDVSSTPEQALEDVFQLLRNIIQEQPQVFVHRDYHSRNLMILDNNNPGILDFQDARLGPITYDLVSLLQDCYISWPREKVLSWIKQFQQLAMNAGIMNASIPFSQLLRWFDLTGVHRHLKNLGIFCRLVYRDKKNHYLSYLHQPLQYIREAITLYPELKPLYELVYPAPVKLKVK